MNRYAWNRSLIEPFTRMSLWGLRRLCNRLWALRMLFVWRYRCGYWDWDAFKAAWRFLP